MHVTYLQALNCMMVVHSVNFRFGFCGVYNFLFIDETVTLYTNPSSIIPRFRVKGYGSRLKFIFMMDVFELVIFS